MVVQLSSVHLLKIRELKAVTQVGHFESIREELRYYN